MINENYNKLQSLGLMKMAELYKFYSNDINFEQMNFDDKMSILLDAEVENKRNNHINRLKKNSNIKYQSANISGIKFYPDREIDKALTFKLATCDYIKNHLNIICVGATGAGKTYYVSALCNAACDKEIPVKYYRLQDLLLDIDIARKNDTYKKKITKLGNIPLLIIDDFLLTPTTTQQQVDLLELLELRSEEKSTILSSQVLPEGWHEHLGSSGLADAILDRITSKSHYVYIKGEKSMRQRETE